MAGGNTDEAQLLLQKWTNPDYAKRAQAFKLEEVERLQTAKYQEAQGRVGEMEEKAAISRNWIVRNWRDAKRWWQKPMEMDARDLEKADDELRQIQRDSDEARGINRLRPTGLMTLATDRVGKMVGEAVKAGKWKTPGLVRNRREGDEALSEEEAKAAGQILGESEGGVSSWLVGEAGGTAQVETGGGQLRHMGEHFWETLGTREKDLHDIQMHSKRLIKERRQVLASADRTSSIVEKLADATGAQLNASSQAIMQSLTGAGGKNPPAQVMAAIRNRVLGKAGVAGRDGLGTTVDDMRSEAAQALADATGMSIGQAKAKLESEKDRWDPWLTSQVMRGPDKDATKAVQKAVDIATGAKVFDIPESEKGLKASEDEVARALGEAGVFTGGEVVSGDWRAVGEKKATSLYGFGQAERGAFEMFHKTAAGVGAGFGEGEAGEAKAQMLSLLVAKEKEEAAGSGKAQAGGALQQLITADTTGKTEEIINDLRKKIASGSKEQTSVLARMAGQFTDFQGTGEEIMKQMTETEKLAASDDSRAKSGARNIYKLEAVRQAIEQKQGAQAAGTKEADKSFGQKAWDWIKDAATDPAEKKEKREQESTNRFDKAVTEFGNWVAQAQLLQGNP
jgi:hypothetical protein